MARLMLTHVSQNGTITYEHYCDTLSDRSEILDKYITLGSYCFVLHGTNGVDVYVADSNKTWCLTPTARPNLQIKNVSANGTVIADRGYDGLEQVIVNVTNGIEVESLTIEENGIYTAPAGVAYTPVTVGVTPNLQSKTITQNGTITPDQGYDGLSNVVVNVSGGGSDTLPSEYQQVEYLEFTGTQYIVETDINLVSGDVIFGFADLDPSVASSTEDGIMGGNASSTYEIYYYNDALQYYGNITGLNNSDNTSSKKVIAGTLTANGADFAIGRYSPDYVHKGKIWDVLVYRMGANPIYRHYVPCYRKADNVAGYYELMRGVFYTNQGTGTIGVGPDVV